MDILIVWGEIAVPPLKLPICIPCNNPIDTEAHIPALMIHASPQQAAEQSVEGFPEVYDIRYGANRPTRDPELLTILPWLKAAT